MGGAHLYPETRAIPKFQLCALQWIIDSMFKSRRLAQGARLASQSYISILLLTLERGALVIISVEWLV